MSDIVHSLRSLPVDTRPRFNVYTTSCVYWAVKFVYLELIETEACSEPAQKAKMEHFGRIVMSFN